MLKTQYKSWPVRRPRLHAHRPRLQRHGEKQPRRKIGRSAGPAAVLVSIKFAHSADPRACGGKFRLKSRLKTQVELLSLNLKSLVRDPKPFKTDRFLAFPYIFKSAAAESIRMAPHPKPQTIKSFVRNPKPFKTDRFLAFPYIFISAGAESIRMALWTLFIAKLTS
jgi:hypothetical protein